MKTQTTKLNRGNRNLLNSNSESAKFETLRCFKPQSSLKDY